MLKYEEIKGINEVLEFILSSVLIMATIFIILAHLGHNFGQMCRYKMTNLIAHLF